jgi:hypothetical protein
MHPANLLVLSILISRAPTETSVGIPSGRLSLTPALGALMGVPYVEDGVRDGRGHWTTFTHPDIQRPSPGFNCSGLVIEASRRLLGFAGGTEDATRDRRGDSAAQAPLGRDWDFAWDLVLNLSEGKARQVMLPDCELAVSRQADGQSLRGFALDEQAHWQRILPRLHSDRVYLGSISRERRIRRGQAWTPTVEHYHAVLFLKDTGGRTWLYQTLPHGRSHRLEISSPQGFSRMVRMFGPRKRLLLLEVDPY